MSRVRKITKFQVCDRHASWFAGETRSRKIECFAEGGPGGWTPGCKGGRCRIWPGTDYFEASACSGELTLDWTTTPVAVVATPLRGCTSVSPDGPDGWTNYLRCSKSLGHEGNIHFCDGITWTDPA